MITKKDIIKNDCSSMNLIYNDWPSIAKNSFQKDWKKIKFKEYDHIVFAGMGGSGTVGDIFASIFSKSRKHITVVKGYNLPHTVTKNSLVIVISVSGNTSESIAILKKALKENFGLIAFSSGGKMEKFCKKNNIEFRKIEQHNSPRASLVNYIFAMLNILEIILPYDKKDIDYCIQKLYGLGKNISSDNLTNSNQAIRIAKKLKGIPLIYYPWGLQSVAIRFKNNLQENAKSHSMVEDVVESSHNGIVAWEKKSKVFPILLQGENDNIRTKERWKILKEYFDKNKIRYLEVFSEKGGIFTKIMVLVYLLDYVTIYKAIIEKTDPNPVESIKFIKLRIK